MTRIAIKFSIWLAGMAFITVIVLGAYSFCIHSQAESLLKDLVALKPGFSSEAEAQQFTERHKRYLANRQLNEGVTVTTFRVSNRWLSTLKLEPPAYFDVTIHVRDARVYHISASLMREMNIFPTFGWSAGIVDEYSEYPPYMQNHPLPHFEFPTPVGKPYLHVQLDSHAAPEQRKQAFQFSFRCLTKLGGGCDLPCDYLPSAWRAWKGEIYHGDLATFFDEHYPNSSRCK